MGFLSLLVQMVFVALILAACGGGGSSHQAPSGIPLPQQNEAKVGFFMGDPNDLTGYAKDVDYVFTNDWGNWDFDVTPLSQRALVEMQQAKQLGVKEAIVSVGYLVFNSKYQYKGTQYLQVFKTQLEALGLTDMIKTFYVLDEPDIAVRKGLTESDLAKAIGAIHTVFPGIKTMTIYSNSGNTPGIALFDFIGRDDYSKGTGVLTELPKLGLNQRWVIVPGGADPWKQDPTPFMEFAKTNPVEYVVAFLYSDYPNNGKINRGIKDNGMWPVYQAAFQSTIGANQ